MPHPSPRLLALDTSTDVMAVGLVTPDGCWTRHAAGGAAASAELLPLLQQLLAQAGVRLADLDAIAFGLGPGAFTGLRTACAVAQGLALGAAKPVLPIDSLLVVGEDARANAPGPAAAPHLRGSVACAGVPGDSWWVAMDARMDEVYAAHWQWSTGGVGAEGAWRELAPAALYTVPALAARWQAEPPCNVAGNAGEVFADRLPWGEARRWPTCADRAGALLRLAEQAWRAGGGVDAGDALPRYVRDKVALTTAERAQPAAARSAAPDA